MKIHELKTHPKYYHECKRGSKKFEIRKNDRDFKVNDILVLQEFLPSGDLGEGYYTGEECKFKVTSIFEGGEYFAELFGIKYGYCVMSIEKI